MIFQLQNAWYVHDMHLNEWKFIIKKALPLAVKYNFDKQILLWLSTDFEIIIMKSADFD